MSWLKDLVENAERKPVYIKVLKNEEDDGASVFIRGSSFGMEFPNEVVMGLEEVAKEIRAKGQLDGVREFYAGAVCYIPVPGGTGVVVVQPFARVTRFLQRLPVHEDGCEEHDEDEDEVYCECSGPFRLSTRLNTEDRLTVVERPGKSSAYVPVKPPKNCVKLETACAICMTPENVDQLLRAFPQPVASTKRKADVAPLSPDAKKQKV